MKYAKAINLILCGCLLFAIQSCDHSSRRLTNVGARLSLGNEGFLLTLTLTDSTIVATLDDKTSQLRLADGPLVYRYDSAGHENVESVFQLSAPSIQRKDNRLIVNGRLGAVDLKHTFMLPDGSSLMEENITLTNHTGHLISLPDFEAGFTRSVMNGSGGVAELLENDRWVAVPFRERPDDPSEFVHDFSFYDLISTKGSEPHPNSRQWVNPAPSRHRWSEGWAWTHEAFTLGIFSFCQENMQFSVLSVLETKEDTLLRFGGFCMIMNEPAALSRLEPGQSVDLGIIRYQTTRSDYVGAMYAYRKMLDDKGCRFPDDYDPPVHWNQIFDMEGAWDHREDQYTRDIIDKEARKAVKFGCDALYLDPGWDTEFASFLWGEEWLGPRAQFMSDMRTRYGLDVALHTPLGTWMSVGYPMGPSAVHTFPESACRRDPAGTDEIIRVPAVRDNRRNLSLLPAAKADASSISVNYAIQEYKISQLNDGWYGNSQSWIAGELPAWAEIDLGQEYTISRVCLGNDHTMSYASRHGASELTILVATDYESSSSAFTWRKVAEYSGSAFKGEMILDFSPVKAQWLRVLISGSPERLPRLDEIEIYEHDTVSDAEALSYKTLVKYDKRLYPVSPPLICMGSKQYMDEAEKRLLANCEDGAVFLMFDGNWWNGGCSDENHGHPVPYRFEDHMRANVEMAQRIHSKYPEVLIEMHDMIIGGSFARVTPVYYKYGLPGSYDENWGFELMWDPLASLLKDQAVLKDPTYKPGKAIPLYYYNLGCNVPIYLHIDLSSDNKHCLSLWWYASTCRHLGVGGTHVDPEVVAAQAEAMKKYKDWAPFYKRGEFYGISEEIHLHVLPAKQAFTVNVFNLSDQTRTIRGSILLADLGLEADRPYSSPVQWGRCEDGVFTVEIELPPWSTKPAIFQ